ncbi:hypothetical protein BX666DRAFT_1927616 [Dichotomocladium elegans]|nr:hypothetical protein BX666DRAFT_1927616 [Dichotomocladium elegans]
MLFSLSPAISDENTLVPGLANPQSQLRLGRSSNWECFNNTCNCEAIPINAPCNPSGHLLIRIPDWRICSAHLANRVPGLAVTRLKGFSAHSPSRYLAVSHVWAEKWFQGAKIKVCMKQMLEDIARYYKVNYLWIDRFCLSSDEDDDIAPSRNRLPSFSSQLLSQKMICYSSTSLPSRLQQAMIVVENVMTKIRKKSLGLTLIQLSPNTSPNTSISSSISGKSGSVASLSSRERDCPCSNTETFVEGMQDMGEIYRGAVCVIILTLETMIEGLAKLNRNNIWMTRGWTVQEGACAKAICVPSIMHNDCYAPVDITTLEPTVSRVLQRKDAGRMSLYTAYSLFEGRRFTKTKDFVYALYGLVHIDESNGDREATQNGSHGQSTDCKRLRVLLSMTAVYCLTAIILFLLWGKVVIHFSDQVPHNYTIIRVSPALIVALAMSVFAMQQLFAWLSGLWHARRTPAKTRRWKNFEWLVRHCFAEIDGRLLSLPLAGQFESVAKRWDLQRRRNSPQRCASVGIPHSRRPIRKVWTPDVRHRRLLHEMRARTPEITWVPLPIAPPRSPCDNREEHLLSPLPPHLVNGNSNDFLVDMMDTLGTMYRVRRWRKYPNALTATNVLYNDEQRKYIRGRGSFPAYYIRLRNHLEDGKIRLKQVDMVKRLPQNTHIVKIANVSKYYQDLDPSRLTLVEGDVVVI